MMTSRRWRIQNKNLTRSLVNISERNFEVNKNYRKSHARVSCGAHFYMSGCASFLYICHVALISIHWSGYAHFHLSCRSHFHTAVRLRSFYIAVSLSYLYSSQAILISIHLSCRSHSHTADVLLSFPLNVWLLLSLSRVAGRIPRAVQGQLSLKSSSSQAKPSQPTNQFFLLANFNTSGVLGLLQTPPPSISNFRIFM